MIINGEQNTQGASDPIFYQHRIHYSCLFDFTDQSSLSRVNGTPDDATIWSFSTWIKRCGFPYPAIDKDLAILMTGVDWQNWSFLMLGFTDVIEYEQKDSDTLTFDYACSGNKRDNAGWFHLYVEVDDSESGNDKLKIYINGVMNYDTTPPTPTSTTKMNILGRTQRIGTTSPGYTVTYGNFYLAETMFADGIKIGLNNVGVFSQGIWVPKQYKGNFGSNGFYLRYEDSSDLGEDFSGNSNDFTSSNITSANQFPDTPNKNYCIIPGGSQPLSSSDIAVTNGDLSLRNATGSSGNRSVFGSFGLTSGKWYWEGTVVTSDTTYIGIVRDFDLSQISLTYCGDTLNSYSYGNTGSKFNDGSGVGYSSPYINTAVISILLNLDDGEISFWEDGIDGGVAFSSLSGTFLPCFSCFNDGRGWDINFGQKTFAETMPAGYKTLHSENLALMDKSIFPVLKGFDIVQWAGDSASPRSFTGLNFSPNIVIIKSTSLTGDWVICNSEVGGDALLLNGTDTEDTANDDGYVSTFDDDGFTIVDGDSFDFNVNNPTRDYIAYCFKIGPEWGINVVGHSGSSSTKGILHELGYPTEFSIHKCRDDTYDWAAYHHYALNKTDPETDYNVLNDDPATAFIDDDTVWDDTAPSITTFFLGTNVLINENTKNYCTFHFRSIEGFSRTFSYTGNAAQNGPFIFTNFLPKLIIIKGLAATRNWVLIDGVYNPDNPVLYGSELNKTDDYSGANVIIQFLVNGFKIASNSLNDINATGETFVGIAFADHPFKYAITR